MAGAGPRSRLVRLAARIAIVPMVAVGLWCAGFAAFVAATPHRAEDMDTPTDAIVVLTGGPARLDTGVDLLERGLSRRMLISGVMPGIGLDDIMRQARLPGQAPPCCIDLDPVATDTYGNATETARWVESEGVASVRLITAYYHMPRSLFLFRRALPETTLVPHPVYPRAIPRGKWWRLGYSTRVLHDEYLKYLATVVLARAGIVASREGAAELVPEREDGR
jgi:uncharacterized SAM-binding protein YcdF (DUF218 family)